MKRETTIKAEIEFRGRTAKGEWVYGSFINSVVKGSPFGYIAGNNVVEPIQVMRKTVGQYTGITDKDGKRIYAGDIVKAGLRKYLVCYGLHEIPCCGCCYSFHSSIGFYLKNIETDKIESDEETFAKEQELEVIGNIFDKEGENEI